MKQEQEPEPEEVSEAKAESMFKRPDMPEPEVLQELLQSCTLSKDEKLFFMQLPDSLPGQPPTKEARPVKTEVQSEDGQSMLLKTESPVGWIGVGGGATYQFSRRFR